MSSRDSAFGDPAFLTITLFVLVIGAVLFGGYQCTASRQPEVRRVLEVEGFTEIDLGGYEVFGCGKGDTVREGFVATAPSGERTAGTVCCGYWLKDCTVRIDPSYVPFDPQQKAHR